VRPDVVNSTRRRAALQASGCACDTGQVGTAMGLKNAFQSLGRIAESPHRASSASYALIVSIRILDDAYDANSR
jgi:hypothetical protein